jgi:hypothetical protein
MKNVTFLLKDQNLNSYPTSCPNDACTRKERWKIMLGECQVEDESKASSLVGFEK